jgi:hypothetical protein
VETRPNQEEPEDGLPGGDEGIGSESANPGNYDLEPEGDDSSAGSALASENPAFSDLVDLTGPSWCRVRMSRRNKTVSAVCGQRLGQCGRRGHNRKATLGDQHRGIPGFYYRCEGGPRGLADGYSDKQVFSLAEALTLQANETSAIEELLQTAPTPTEPGPQDMSPDETSQPGLDDTRAPHLGVRPPFQSPAGQSRVGASPRVETVNSPPRNSPLPGTFMDPIPANNAGQDMPTWFPVVFGMENEQGRRIITESKAHCDHLRDRAWFQVLKFGNLAEAKIWANQDRRSTLPGQLVQGGIPPQGGIDTWYGLETGDGHRTYAQGAADANLLVQHGYKVKRIFHNETETTSWIGHSTTNGHGQPGLPTPRPAQVGGLATETRAGPDTSKESDEVFGTNINRVRAMDDLALPKNTTGKETCERLYDCATDVMALPGGYRRSTEYDDETSALTEAVTASLGGRQESHLHVTFRTKSNNGLGQIVVRADLLDMISRVQEAWESAEKTQRSQFIRVLGDQGYSYDETLVYLQTGILPRLIRDTYSCYLSNCLPSIYFTHPCCRYLW